MCVGVRVCDNSLYPSWRNILLGLPVLEKNEPLVNIKTLRAITYNGKVPLKTEEAGHPASQCGRTWHLLMPTHVVLTELSLQP